jgi:hypothetical protein
MSFRIILFAACLGFAGVAQAATILKEEPHAGMLPAGQPVLVDNGKCPAGQVLEVTAGQNSGVVSGAPSKRTRRCVKRPI